MAIAHNRRATIRLTHQELTFIQKLLRSEYHFITEEERHARQAFGRKLSDITLPGSSEGGVELFLTQLEISFLQKLTKSSYSFLTMAERDRPPKTAAQDSQRLGGSSGHGFAHPGARREFPLCQSG